MHKIIFSFSLFFHLANKNIIISMIVSEKYLPELVKKTKNCTLDTKTT